MGREITDGKTIPFAGGENTANEIASLPIGSFSQVQNLRPKRPEFKKRKGMSRQHTAATDTQEVISQFNFSKSGRAETYLLRQMADGSIEKATTNPPGTTTGEFGTEILAARSNAWPASWGVMDDYLLIADGAGLPLIWPAEQQLIEAFNVYKGTVAIPDIPEEGGDYTDDVIDGRSSTVADISSLNTLANYNALYICTKVRGTKLNFTIVLPNGTAATVTLKYRKNDNSWAAVSGFADGTLSGGATFAINGSMTWTLPTDEVPHYMFGRSGFWYEVSVSAQLDSSVTISEATYEGPVQEMMNVWDGILVPAIMARAYINSTLTFNTYASNQIKPGGLTSSDYLHFDTIDPVWGIYLEVGKTPNTAAFLINTIEVWTGAAWTTLTNVKDGTKNTAGTKTGSKSSFISWTKTLSPAPRKKEFKYQYRIKYTGTLSADLTWGISTLPYFDINNISTKCQSVSVWEDRACFCFNDNVLYFSAKHNPMWLNGDDFGFLPCGDGRKNKILCQKPFYNFILVWGEEKGAKGGYLDLIQPGVTVSKIARQGISPYTGIMNAKSAIVLEGVNVADVTPDSPVLQGAFWISNDGAFKTEGRIAKKISGDIENYFDPEKAECIRAGYEDKHWMEYDKSTGVILMGLVSGSSASMPNVFKVYDPITDKWSTDTRPYPLSCMCNVEAASGNIPVLQYGGGQNGRTYRLNDTENDDDRAVHWSCTMELNGRGERVMITNERLRFKIQSSGSVKRLVAKGGSSTFGDMKSLSQIAETAGDSFRRYNQACRGLNSDDHFSYRLTNQLPITSITRSGTTATVTITGHGLATGDTIDIQGAGQSEYNGIKTITVATVDTFTYTVSGSPTTPATGTITATLAGISAHLIDIGLKIEEWQGAGDK